MGRHGTEDVRDEEGGGQRERRHEGAEQTAQSLAQLQRPYEGGRDAVAGEQGDGNAWCLGADTCALGIVEGLYGDGGGDPFAEDLYLDAAACCGFGQR